MRIKGACTSLFPQLIANRHRKVVYVTFESSRGPFWVRKNTNTSVVCGFKPPEERTAAGSHGLKTRIQSMSVIMKEIQQLLSSSNAHFQRIHVLTLLELQSSIVIIDCITPVFLEQSMDPIHFLRSILSLQRTQSQNEVQFLTFYSILCCSFSSYRCPFTTYIPTLSCGTNSTM